MGNLPVLMYHQVSLSKSEGLTIAAEKLEAHFAYLKEKGYRTYHCSELLSLRKLPHHRNVMITFDDGYVDQLELAYPLLKKYGLKATFFIPLKYLGKTDEWNSPSYPIMTATQLRSLDPSVVELGFHSFAHRRYDEMTHNEVEADTKACFEITSEEKLPLSAVLAYPYGRYPRTGTGQLQFEKHLSESLFQLAFRIGNRINKFPFKKPFEVQRLDVKGEYSLKKFKRKLTYGKLF